MSLDQNRKLILEILNRMERQNSYLNILLPSYFSRYNLKSQDRAFLQEISYGVTRFKKRLDWIISQFLTQKSKKIPLTVQNILRMGVYQFYYLDKIPDYALAYETVELVKNSPYPDYSGMVNAIIRNVIRKPNEISWPELEREPVKYISVFYSFPEWLVERWLNRFGLELCQKICQASNTIPALTVRINPLKADMTQFKEKLTELKVIFQESLFLPTQALIIKDFPEMTKSLLFQKGYFSIQDESSMLASEFLAPLPGETVIDMCSGPGGKATHMAQLMQNKGKIIALEIKKARLVMVKEEAKRLDINIILSVLKDSCKLNEEYLEKADKILVDVPCSGTGVIRKKPDIKWKQWNLNHLSELNKVQSALLDTATHYLKPGGEILYTTCSMEKEENEDIIRIFLKKNTNFVIQESLPFSRKRGIVSYNTGIKEAIQLIPGYSGPDIDGFYMLKMRKKK